MALEQAAGHDDQGKAQEETGDLAAAGVGHRQEQGVADDQRIGDDLDIPNRVAHRARGSAKNQGSHSDQQDRHQRL